MKSFWTAVIEPRRLMLIAIVLFGLSQFFDYIEDNSVSYLGVGWDLKWDTWYLYYDPGGTGWDVHPWAGLVVAALFFLFVSRTHEEAPLPRLQIWWVAAVALIACLFPTDGVMFGPAVGALACLLALFAAFRHQQETAGAPAAP